MAKIKKEKIPLRSEHDEQVSLFKMIALHSHKYPALRFAFAVPNGARTSLRTAVRLKAEGMTSGVPDICIPIPQEKKFRYTAIDSVVKVTHYGLFIEMKKRGSNQRLKPNQIAYRDYLIGAGYQHNVCYNADEAMNVILEYLR